MICLVNCLIDKDCVGEPAPIKVSPVGCIRGIEE
jgi:hypothetical protein